MGRKKKMVGAIIDNDKNEGLHSVRALTAVQHVMTHHDLKKAVLYHLVVTGSQDKKVYQALRKKLVRRIRDHGCRVEYFGAFEVAEDKGGLHMHCFLLIETAYKLPYGILNVNDGKFLHKLADEFNLANNGQKRRIHIAKPKNPMHEGQFYARMNTPEKLANALAWIEYPYKNRSKDAVPGRETYFASEFKSNVSKRQAKRKKPISTAALPAAAEEAIQQHELTNAEGITNEEIIATRLQASSTEATASSADHDSSASTKGLVDAGQCSAASTSYEAGNCVTWYGTKAGPEARANSSREAGSVTASATPSPLEYAEAQQQGRAGRSGPCHQGGIEMTLTSAQQYLMKLYRKAVDADMDVEQVRKFLLSRGVLRTPGQVAYDLTSVYGFTDYVTSHQPKATMSVATWDKAAYRV